MGTEELAKKQYFANGDFEKVAADIISSPRRVKPIEETLDDTLLTISEKQQEYYSKCFKHLLKTTQGSQEMNGAVFGGDQRVVEFFKRSALDFASLSKIWSLSDVNEDGWLDLAEFSIAMHLVVLKVKGEVPIPNVLPAAARPPYTPPRISSGLLSASQSSQCSATPSISSISKMKTSPSWNPEPSSTIDAFTSPPAIKQFSDTPPLLVDSRPTAIKHSALLSLKSPSGPPPAPPPRPQQRGHARSASLDLKLIALNNGRVLNQSTLATPTAASRSNIAGETSDSNGLLSPRSPVPPSSNSVAEGPPPVPLRASPPEKISSLIHASTQTESRVFDEEDVRRFIQGFGGQMDDLLGEDLDAIDGEGPDRWGKRCLALRKQNAEMEAERARLAQVRLQLEIRLQEFEERSKAKC
ncbi:unnamed protein product [Caenorhabditis auriculariae]|uniref:EF-hand domain-containing protein n=1 Tax=Caenorhabditis auriculariae TaxID=2777116 RepID=A0A8S1GU67_9PELO|nr:unnamed protein product [Caenorhabditis auriculariae]